MKVLHVNKFLYRRGGAEAYMLDVAELQRSQGHDVEFFGMQHPENPPQTYEAQFPPHIDTDPPPASASGRVRAAARMLYSTSARRGMDAVLEDFRPDIVHLHNIYHQLSPSILRAVSARGVPAVMTLHDAKLACPTYLFLNDGEVCEACIGGRFYNAALKRCKNKSFAASALVAVESYAHRATSAYGPVRLFVCPSEFLAGKMTEAGVYPDRLRVVGNFVAADRGPSLRDNSRPSIVYAGRLSREKGPDVLVEAMAHVRADAVLHIAGAGPLQAALEERAAAVAPGRVTFHGRVPKAQVLALLSSATVLALPSRCHENQPMTILEAFAAGVPVVGTNLGGVPELVKEGQTGALVAPNDPQGLGASLDAVLSDPVAARRMGQAGREAVEATFSPEHHLDHLMQIYREAIGEEVLSPCASR